MVNAFPRLPPPAIVTARQMPKGMGLEGDWNMLESLCELWAVFPVLNVTDSEEIVVSSLKTQLYQGIVVAIKSSGV